MSLDLIPAGLLLPYSALCELCGPPGCIIRYGILAGAAGLVEMRGGLFLIGDV